MPGQFGMNAANWPGSIFGVGVQNCLSHACPSTVGPGFSTSKPSCNAIPVLHTVHTVLRMYSTVCTVYVFRTRHTRCKTKDMQPTTNPISEPVSDILDIHQDLYM